MKTLAICAEIAAALGLDTTGTITSWEEETILAVIRASVRHGVPAALLFTTLRDPLPGEERACHMASF